MIRLSVIETALTNARSIGSSRRFRTVMMGILAGLSLIAFWFLVWRVLYELDGQTNRDSHLYFAVGRGILNGLVPYRDLFESKPPGMFLLSALSFALTGSPLLMHILEALCIAGIAALVTWAAVRETSDADAWTGVFWIALAFLYGTILALYADNNAGRVQTESYGAFFAILYLTFLFCGAHRRGWKGTTVLALGIVGAVQLKEPFAISIAAAALLLLRDGR
jgi:hypothetical protein